MIKNGKMSTWIYDTDNSVVLTPSVMWKKTVYPIFSNKWFLIGPGGSGVAVVKHLYKARAYTLS